MTFSFTDTGPSHTRELWKKRQGDIVPPSSPVSQMEGSVALFQARQRGSNRRSARRKGSTAGLPLKNADSWLLAPKAPTHSGSGL